jgi:hypothetical protein
MRRFLVCRQGTLLKKCHILYSRARQDAVPALISIIETISCSLKLFTAFAQAARLDRHVFRMQNSRHYPRRTAGCVEVFTGKFPVFQIPAPPAPALSKVLARSENRSQRRVIGPAAREMCAVRHFPLERAHSSSLYSAVMIVTHSGKP